MSWATRTLCANEITDLFVFGLLHGTLIVLGPLSEEFLLNKIHT